MSHVVCAFGPDGSYFYQSSTEWAWHGLPPTLAAKFQDSAGGHQIRFVYEMALGANGSFYVGFKAKDGSIYSSKMGLPDDLATWLNKNRHGDTVRVSLGPNNASWWAMNTSGGAYRGHGLPDAVSAALKKESPRLISLGYGGTYIMIATGGGAHWNVASQYPELNKYLDVVKAGGPGSFRQINYISLGACEPKKEKDATSKYYALAFNSGSYYGAVPEGTEAAAKKVLDSVKAKAAAQPVRNNNNNNRRQSNFSNFLKLANSGLKLVNALNGVQQGGGGGGWTPNNSSGPSFDTSAFTAGLQQQTWATTSSAAQDQIQ